MSKDKIREQYEYFFKLADADGDGFVTGGEAAALFRKSGLSDEALRNVRMINNLAYHMHLVNCGKVPMIARKVRFSLLEFSNPFFSLLLVVSPQVWAQVSQGQPNLNKSAFFMALGLIALVQGGKEAKLSDLGVGKSTSSIFCIFLYATPLISCREQRDLLASISLESNKSSSI